MDNKTAFEGKYTLDRMKEVRSKRPGEKIIKKNTEAGNEKLH